MASARTCSTVLALITLAGCITAQGYGGSKSDMLRGSYPQGGLAQAGGQQAGRRAFDQGARYNSAQEQSDNQYKFRIYTEPEYYGYESVFPGGRANFKGYRSNSDTNSFGTGPGYGDGVESGRVAPNRYRAANRDQQY